MSYRLERCPACEATTQRDVGVARDRHYGIQGEYRVAQCDSCELVFLNPMYEDSELARFYPQDYYAYQDHSRELSPALRFVHQMLGFQDGTKDPIFERPGKVLDIGCGSGWFLSKRGSEGWQTCGVEISEAAARLGAEQAGLNIFRGTLLEAGFPADSFDYVRLNHSFEHISCPNETLREIYRILRPGGSVLIAVPNYSSLNARMFGRYWFYLGIPVHAFSYSANNLSRLLTRSGLEVRSVIHNSNYAGILGSFQIWLNRNNGKRSTEGFFINAVSLRVVSQWMAKIFDWFGQGDVIEAIAWKPLR